MNTKTILGISLAAVFAISMTTTAAMADIPGSLTVTDAGQTEDTFFMDLVNPVKEFNSKKAPDIVTFWAWSIPTQGNGETLRVAAITLHHNINDQAAFDPIFCPDDKSPQCKSIKSSPVQSFHPHYAEFTELTVADGSRQLCVTNLESPKLDFRVHNQETITFEDESNTYTGFYATGTIGAIDGCPIGLGITSVVSDNFPQP
jgi:hypothetical protein